MWPAADTEPSVAFVTDAAPVERILIHIGEPPTCASDCPARGPHACADVPAPMPDWNLLGQPSPTSSSSSISASLGSRRQLREPVVSPSSCTFPQRR
jgi:hypothetical protein